MHQMRRALAAQDPEGLRPSHLRLLDAVPADGRGISDLAATLGMTKQGAGQLVAALESAGFVEVRPDPSDARRRVVARTVAGERSVADLRVRLAAVEAEWAARVGAQRYAVFRAVLEELGLPDPPAAT